MQQELSRAAAAWARGSVRRVAQVSVVRPAWRVALQEINYEAYGPGGTGIVVSCLTDNVNRTASEVKPTLTKAGAKVRARPPAPWLLVKVESLA